MYTEKTKQNKGGKQMAKRLGALLCLLVMVSFIASPAFAAVQNVKVGGDITLIGASRDNFDLRDTRGVDESGNSDELDGVVSQARIRIDADLSDNVSTTIRLLNERIWDQDSAAENIDLDLASMTLKEFLYSPLTLTLGRQELRYGNALVVGDPDTNIVTSGGNLGNTVAAGLSDVSLYKAFDAIKAVLDYNPLKVDLIYAKVDENTVVGSGQNDDVDLFGVNLNYPLDKNNTVLEGYYFGKYSGDSGVAEIINGNYARRINKAEKIHTIGARVSTDPIEKLNLQGELAYQFGNYDPSLDENSLNAGTALAGKRSAWAAQVIGDYKFKAKYDPRLTGTYSFFSGEENNRVSGKYNGWNAMFEDQTLGDIANKIFAPSNAHVFTISAQAKPAEDLTAQLTYAYLRLAKEIKSGGNVNLSGPDKPILTLNGLNGGTTYNMQAGKSSLGQEIDLHLAYAYTEDVQLMLLTGVFIPGSAFAKPENRDPATQAVVLAKVTF